MTTKLLSLSGGGWNTMSNLAGALTGSIDRLEAYGLKREIGTLLSEYDYISGNSGGTWFLTSLAFSNEYQSSLENRESADSYNTSGFSSRVKNTFDQIGYASSNKDISVAKMLLKFKRNWGDFIERTVYDQTLDPNIKEINFTSSNLTNWARQKNLGFATSLTKKSSLNSSGSEIPYSDQFYGPPIAQQGAAKNKIFSSYAPESPASKRYDASNFSPLLISIREDGQSVYRASDNQSDISINFSNNEFWGPEPQTKSFAKNGSAESVKAIGPSLASSSALAAAAFPKTYKKSGIQNQMAYTMRSLAPIISLNDQKISNINQEPTTLNSFKDSFNNIANNGYIRTADGGYLDNTSVAFNLSSAFQNSNLNELNGFELSLFQNNSDSQDELVTVNGKYNSSVLFPSDLAALFGLDEDRRPESVNGVKIHPESGLWMLSPQVFTPQSLKQADLTPIWSWNQENGGDIQLALYNIDVETIANDAYGIDAGVKGTLNVYLSLNPSSDAIPYKQVIHQDYFDNFNAWRDAIKEAPHSIPFFDSLDHIPMEQSGQSINLSSSAERVIGTDGNDKIKAYAGDDHLSGGDGKDRLIGGRGADTLSGGPGQDIFRYQSLNDSKSQTQKHDTISDFKPGKDTIDLRPISKNLELRFIGKNQFEQPGDIRVQNRALHLNTDNDAQSEFKIKLPGTNPNQLSADDFLMNT